MTAVKNRVRTADVREDHQAASRESPALGRGEALGRDGKPVRRIKVSGDRFWVPPELIPDGWAYQWNVVTVKGQENPSDQAALVRAGWTPVPAERHPGLFVPNGTKGPIIVDGLRLDERPMELEMEARTEDRQQALHQVNGSREQFGFRPTASGFEGSDTSNNPAVRNNSFAKVSREQVTVPRPKYEMSVD